MDTNPEQPAFPRDHRYDGHNGMTLRDWFAGQALASISQHVLQHEAGRLAYSYADAMLAERIKGGVVSSQDREVQS